MAIDWKDYAPGAYPYFVNDIAAAKAFLDQKNDALECNSSSLILIGANEGATLGAMWMKSEWYRVPLVQKNPFNPALGMTPNFKDPAGKKVSGAIFLSVAGKLTKDGPVITVPTWLQTPVLKAATPAVFIYNDKRKDEKALSEFCGTKLKIDNDKRYKFTGATPIDTAPEGLSGSDLLEKDLKTDKMIVEWLDKLTNAAPPNNWANQDFGKTPFVWAFTAQNFIQANNPQMGSKTMNFCNYYGIFEKAP